MHYDFKETKKESANEDEKEEKENEEISNTDILEEGENIKKIEFSIYDKVYFINEIIKAIRGKNNEDINSPTRKVLEIYTFRLIYYFLNKDYKKFKHYDFDSKLLTYRKNFTGKESIEEENPKFLDFCGKSIEDFINIPDETPKEIVEEQNFYTHSLLSIKVVGKAASRNGFISNEDYIDIWNYFIDKLKKKRFNVDLKIEDIILMYDMIDDLSVNLKNMISNEKKLFLFNSNNNFVNEYNNKYIGIIIYILRICFHSFTIENGFLNYFYSKLINPNNNNNKIIINLINNSFIPGFTRGKKGIEKLKMEDLKNKNDFTIIINNIENEVQIRPLTIIILKILFYSHLLFAILTLKLNNKLFIDLYSTIEKFTCFKIIFELWEKLYELIPGTENNKVEIFLNRINKDIVKIYKQCQNLKTENERNIFENNFNNYINECIEDYEYFKLIYYNKSIKAIIQEDNYPLSYNSIDYPYIKYFVVSHYPKIEDLKNIKNNFQTKNKWDLCMIDSFLKFNNIEYKHELILTKIIQIYIKYFTLTPFIHKISFSLRLESFANNNDILFKCKKMFENSVSKEFKNKYFNELEKFEKNNKKKLIGIQNKFLDNLLKEIKNKNEYLYKNIRRKININSLFEEQIINFAFDEISNYISEIELVSKYIYKDVFSSESKNISQYVAINRLIEYHNYQNYFIHLDGLENELISILLPNKRMFDIKMEKYIPCLRLFKENNKNILYNFLNIYPNSIDKLDNNFEDIILNVINNNDKDIVNIYIENSFLSLYKHAKFKI